MRSSYLAVSVNPRFLARRGSVSLALAVCAFLCFAANSPVVSQGQPRVQATLMPEATVRGPQIRLGDLGLLQGDQELVARASAVVVGQAPLPGRQREVTLEYIRICLRQNRLDPDTFEFLSPPRIVVRGAGKLVTGEDLVRAAEAAVQQTLCPGDGETILAEPLTVPASLVVPEGALSVVPEAGQNRLVSGAVATVRLRVLVNGELVAAPSVTLRWRRLVAVWVAARDIAPGSLLAESDCTIDRRDIAGVQQPLLAERPVLGMRARRAIAKGTLLTSALVDAPPAVRRGDTVAVEVRSGLIRVRVMAKALDEGAPGSEIRVVNLGDMREYRVCVLGPGKAEPVVEGGRQGE